MTLLESGQHQQLYTDLCMKVRWPSWAPVPNKPMVSVDVTLNQPTTLPRNGTRGLVPTSDTTSAPVPTSGTGTLPLQVLRVLF